METTKQKLIAISAMSLLCYGISTGLQAAPLPNDTVLSLDQGVGSGTNTPCSVGSCYGIEVAPGLIIWEIIGPGTDGGLIIGKNQVSGGQELAPSAGNPNPGEVTTAWAFAANFGTYYTPAGTTNIYSDTSCVGVSCLGQTELRSWNMAFNGASMPLGSANGCLSASCSADQLAGVFVTEWTVGSGVNGLPYTLKYGSVGPANDPTGFGNIKFHFILRGVATPPPAQLAPGTILSLDKGVGAATNIPCATGTCFGAEVAPGLIIWTNLGPGTDGGLIIGKNQASGGQEIGPSAGNFNPGEVTAAWNFIANFGTFYTPAGATNLYSDTSCTGASCRGQTELRSWNVAWNGASVPVGSANGCLSTSCSADQLAGIFVTEWTVGPGVTTLPYSLKYGNVVQDKDPSSFGNVKFSFIFRGVATPPAQLAPGTLLTIEQGVGSASNSPCATGSCMGKELASGLVFWRDLGPGTDGGIVVGKNQASGGQELAASPTNNTPGEMTGAHNLYSNYGTWHTPAGATNTFSRTSCTGADCLDKTVLRSLNEAWNGNSIPFGDICNSANCSADQLAGIMVDQWIVNPGGSYALHYSNISPDGDASGYGNIKTSLILRGQIIAPLPPPLISGLWPTDGPPGTFVFVFGENFVEGKSFVQVNGIDSPIVQVLDQDILIFLLPEGDTNGPVRVTTAEGSAASSISFGVPTTGLNISGLWPASGGPGSFVFLFGTEFVVGNTQVALNGTPVPLAQTLDDSITVMVLPSGISTGPFTVTTPSATATSGESFTVR